MAEIVNLRQARKQKKRAGDKERAAENRALHGLTKTEKAMEKDRRDAEARRLEGHRRTPEDGSPDQ
ncbi:DUF4169 family protein [Amorphus orientalis]|uniref:Uncharacterized protein n=1 Tax=Amorphus orientalis TaxID=649198 RepID=A0AAE3VML3_9HYPH|nr:DUF4169 family protein [Amorphus orientalis]MDQ0315279.1 hypothetical protein [Amorphus orientalis]